MKLFLVVCLVASVFAAPAEDVKTQYHAEEGIKTLPIESEITKSPNDFVDAGVGQSISLANTNFQEQDVAVKAADVSAAEVAGDQVTQGVAQPAEESKVQAKQVEVAEVAAPVESVKASEEVAEPIEESNVQVKNVEIGAVPTPAESVEASEEGVQSVKGFEAQAKSAVSEEISASVESVPASEEKKEYEIHAVTAEIPAPIEAVPIDASSDADETAAAEDESSVKPVVGKARSAFTTPFESKFGSAFGTPFEPLSHSSSFRAGSPYPSGFNTFGYNKINPSFQPGSSFFTNAGAGFPQSAGSAAFAGYNGFDYSKYNPSFQTGSSFFSNAVQQPAKAAEEAKVETESASKETSAETAKTADNSAKTEDKSTTKGESNDAVSTITSSPLTPFQSKFGSQFGSTFNSAVNPAVNPSLFPTRFGAPAPGTPGYDAFGYHRYNQYNPGYNQYNPGYQFGYNKYNPGYQPGYNSFFNTVKDSAKPAEETKEAAKPTSDEASAETTKTADESAKKDDKSTTTTTTTGTVTPFESKFGSQFGSTFNSPVNPAVNPSLFASPFGAPLPGTPGYNAFGYNRYNPTFQPGYNQYNPGYNQYNPGYQFGYNKYNAGYQPGFSAFSNAGKDSAAKPAETAEVVAKPTSAEASAEATKTTDETAKTEDKPSTTSSATPFLSKVGSQFGLTSNSAVNPAVNPSLFAAPFGAPAPGTPGYNAFGYNRYNPGFQPGYNQYNPGYQFGYNKYNPGYQPGFSSFFNTGKETTKTAEETKAQGESAEKDDKSTTTTTTAALTPFQSKFGSQLGSAFNSPVNPAVNPSLFASPSGAPLPGTPGYNAFGYNRYNPTFQPGYNQYNPGYNQYNPGYQFGYNKYNAGYQPGFNAFSNAGKESTKPAEATEVIAKPASAEASAEAAKTTDESAKTEDKPTPETVSNNVPSTTTSSGTPFESKFGSPFNSAINPAVNPALFPSRFGAPSTGVPPQNAFGYNKYNPGFQSGYNQYNPSYQFGYNKYNPGFQSSSSFFSNSALTKTPIEPATSEEKLPAKTISSVAAAAVDSSSDASKTTVEAATVAEKLPAKTLSTDAAPASDGSPVDSQPQLYSSVGSAFKPGVRSPASSFVYSSPVIGSSSQEAGAFPSDSDKELIQPAEETQFKIKSAEDKVSSDEPTVESTPVEEKAPVQPLSSDAAPAIDSSSDVSKAAVESSATKEDLRAATLPSDSSSGAGSSATPSQPKLGSTFGSPVKSDVQAPFTSSSFASAFDASPFRNPAFTKFNPSFQPGFASSSTADKEPVKPAEEFKVKTEPAVAGASSDAETPSVESAAVEKKLPATALPSDSSPSTGSFASSSLPKLGSTFGSPVKSDVQAPFTSSSFASAFDASPFRNPAFTKFNPSFQPSFASFSTADKEPVKPAEEFKVKTEPAVAGASSAAETPSVESAAVEKKLPATTLPSDSSPSTGSFASSSLPKLGSTFGSPVKSDVQAPFTSFPFASAFDASPFRNPAFTKLSPSFQPGFAFFSTADKEPVKPADEEFKVKTESAVAKAAPGPSELTVESATTEEKVPVQPIATPAIDSSSDDSEATVESSAAEEDSPAATLSSDLSSGTGSSATPSQLKLGSDSGSPVKSDVKAPFTSSSFASAFDASPFRNPAFTKFNPSFQPSFAFSSTADKEPVEPADELKVKTESAVAEAAPAAEAHSVESAAAEKKLPATILASDSGLSTGSLATGPAQPKLGSTFESAVDSKVQAPATSSAFASAFSTSPFRQLESNTFGFNKYNPSFGKEPVESTDELKQKSEFSSAGASAGASSNGESVTGIFSQSKLSSPFVSAFDSGIRSPGNPSFYSNSLGSPYPHNAGFNTFSNVKYNPNYESGFAYNPSFGNYNGNYKYNNNNWGNYNGYQGAGYSGFPSGFGNYPGYDQAFKGKTTQYQFPSVYPRPFPEDYNKDVPYVPPHPFQFRFGTPVPQNVATFPFPAPVAAAKIAPSEKESSSEQLEHKITDAKLTQTEEQSLKNYENYLKNTENYSVRPTASSFAETAASLSPRLEVVSVSPIVA